MTTQTKDKQQSAQQNMAQEQPQQGKQAVAVLQPPRLPYHKVYEDRYGIDGMMWRALVDAVYPSAKTPEGIILAVSYCKAKNYDVMKKMVHVVPIWSSSLKREVEGVWESVAALRATAFRTNQYAGCDETAFGPMTHKTFSGEVGRGDYAKQVSIDLEYPEWAQVTVYRLVQGVRCAFPGPKVYFLGAYGCQGKSDVPNDKWSEGPSYMLEKCAEAAALRKAFPEETGGINVAEEMEGRKVDTAPGPTIDHEPAPPKPTRQQARDEAEQARKDEYQRGSQFRQTMQEDVPAQREPIAETGERVDTETGEVTEGDRTPPEPDDRDAGSRAAPQSPSSGAPHASVPERQAAPAAPDYEGTAKQLIELISRSSSRINFEKIVANRSEDIDLLRTEAAEHYEAVQKAIVAKRAWFSK